MVSNLPVVRSAPARALFLASAVITALLLAWTHRLAHGNDFHGLTPIFFVLFAVFDYSGARSLLLVLVLAACISGRLPVRPLLRWISDHSVLVAAMTTALLCAGALVVYHNHPLAMDEYAPLFQSQAFAAGKLSGQFPVPLLDWLIPRGFQHYFFKVSHASGAVTSAYWPSFALLLTPFTWLGISWACNPVLSGLTLITVHRLTLRMFDDPEAAGLAVLFTAASPVFFADGISYYSMTAHLLANGLVALLLLDPTPRRALLAGLVGSIALTLHNPVPHLLFVLPYVLWLASRRAAGAKLLAWLALGYAPLCIVLGLGWFWYTTGLSQDGIATASGAAAQADSLQIGAIFAIPDSTVLFARAIGVAKIWLWAVPGLMILAVIGAWKWWQRPASRLLAAAALLTLFGYLMVPVDQGHGWGYRYFHSAWLALPVLAAGALASVEGSAARLSWTTDEALRTFVAACALLTLIIGVGLRAQQVHGFIREDLTQQPTYAGTEPRIEIIAADNSFYGQDLVQNDPFLRGNVMRMISHGAAADALMMSRYLPTFHKVAEDRYGTVWSTATPVGKH